MELKKSILPIYSLQNEWDKFIDNNQPLIQHVQSGLLKLSIDLEHISIGDLEKSEPNLFEINIYRFLIAQKSKYNLYKPLFDGFIKFDSNGRIDTQHVLPLLINKLFKDNSTLSIKTSSVKNTIENLGEFYRAYILLDRLLIGLNNLLNAKDPSIAVITFENIEITAYNHLLKKLNTAEKKSVLWENSFLQVLDDNAKSLKELNKSKEDKIDSYRSQVDNLKEKLLTLEINRKLSKENFLSYCVLKVEIPDLRVLYNIIAPLNLFFSDKAIDFTRFCWFFDSFKLGSEEEDIIYVNFQKGSISAKGFGKFLYELKIKLFKHNTGYSFEQWLNTNFIFISARGTVTTMDRFIRKYETKDAPSLEIFEDFLKICNNK